MSYSRYSASQSATSKPERDPRAIIRGECAQLGHTIRLATGATVWVEFDPGQGEGASVMLFTGFTVDPPRSARPDVTVSTYRQALEWCLAKYARDPMVAQPAAAPAFTVEQLTAMLAAAQGGATPAKGKALA